MKKLLPALIIALLATGVTANAHGNLDVGPGMVGPGSPIYGLEVAMDNAAVSIGLAKAGGVAQERAAEANKAAENGNYEAAQRAADQMNSIAQKAKSSDTQGLEKAIAVLEEVRANAPEQAHSGLDTALSNVRQARERARSGGQVNAPDDSGSGGAAGTRPEGTGGNWTDTPGSDNGPGQ